MSEYYSPGPEAEQALREAYGILGQALGLIGRPKRDVEPRFLGLLDDVQTLVTDANVEARKDKTTVVSA